MSQELVFKNKALRLRKPQGSGQEHEGRQAYNHKVFPRTFVKGHLSETTHKGP